MSENSKKVIVIGDGYVGKTCLVSKISEGKFINNYHTTIGGKSWVGLLEKFVCSKPSFVYISLLTIYQHFEWLLG